MGRVAARTRGSTTRDLVRGGIYAFIGVVHLAIFLIGIEIGSRGGFPPIYYWLVMSLCQLGLASWCLIPGVASYRRERSRRTAASRP
jgi:hypothetical protein